MMLFGITLGITQVDVLREMTRFFAEPETGSYTGPILMLAAAVMIGSGYAVWRWQQRIATQVGSHALLRKLGTSIGLTGGQRRLLWKIARAADLEPAMALISPQLFTQMIRRGELAGMTLSARQAVNAGKILDVIASAAGKGTDVPAAGLSA